MVWSLFKQRFGNAYRGDYIYHMRSMNSLRRHENYYEFIHAKRPEEIVSYIDQQIRYQIAYGAAVERHLKEGDEILLIYC